jgi:hypothetical protein
MEGPTVGSWYVGNKSHTSVVFEGTLVFNNRVWLAIAVG